MPVILVQSVPCLSLNSTWLDRSGVNLPCFVLDCSSLGRCSTFVRSPWLIRTLSVSPSKPSLAFVDDLIAHLGSVGAALGSSNVVLNVARSAADGVLVDLLCHLQQDSYFFMVYQLQEAQLPPVSPHARLLVFRSELQVSFLPFFPSPFRVNCCHGFYLMESSLKPTMIQFGFRFNQTMYYFTFAGR